MINNKKILALIPARGGSKGLPNKNIMELEGKPLIGWPIQTAMNSKYTDKVIVSTDMPDIAKIASGLGAEVPFLRPPELATDTALSIDVIIHALKFMEQHGEIYDYLVLLEPTSPLTEPADVDNAIESLEANRHRADSIVGVSKNISTHPVFNVVVNKNSLIEPFLKDAFSIAGRRQELETLYFMDGSLYISSVPELILKRTFYHERTLPYITPKWKSFEIDDMVDFICVEAILKNINKIKNIG